MILEFDLVIVRHAMKKKLSPYFYSCPHLIEYISSLDEEQEVRIAVDTFALLLRILWFRLTHFNPANVVILNE